MVLPEGEWSRPRTGDSGVLLAQVLRHNRPSEEDFKKQEASLRQNLLSERQRVIFTEWYGEIRKSAKIQDYREEIFGV